MISNMECNLADGPGGRKINLYQIVKINYSSKL